MPGPWVPTLLSVGVISLVSLVGLLTIPFHVLRRHGVLFALIALAAGTLLGDVFFHLLPESLELWGEFSLTMGALIMVGFLTFYVLESALRMGHAHGEAGHAPHDVPPTPAARAAASARLATGRAAGRTRERIKAFGILNLVGDTLHNFLDGVVVAAAFLVDTPTGIATAIAVAIHEIPQEFGDFGVLLRAGFRPLAAAGFNLLSAVAALVGAALMLSLPFEPEVLERYALPIVAGGFLYIAAADLVPELHHHTRPRYIPLVVTLLLAGLAIMVSLTFMEA